MPLAALHRLAVQLVLSAAARLARERFADALLILLDALNWILPSTAKENLTVNLPVNCQANRIIYYLAVDVLTLIFFPLPFKMFGILA
jgi:hypothetical protein